MDRVKKAVLYLCCSLPDLVTALPLLILWASFGENFKFEWAHGTWAFTFNLKEGSWPTRTWYERWSGTTLGRVVMLNHNASSGAIRSRVLRHEFVHIETYEVGCVFGALILVVADPLFQVIGLWFPFLMWCFSSWLFSICAFTTAWLRGENIYRGSVNEEAAYDAVRLYEQDRLGK